MRDGEAASFPVARPPGSRNLPIIVVPLLEVSPLPRPAQPPWHRTGPPVAAVQVYLPAVQNHSKYR
ncbi:MAG TPA: hypothetical protein GXX55_05315 [Firmicutes bacterium]|nr:hypothetical protein [Bacillota bacterium]